MEIQEIINAILDWAENSVKANQINFDTTFVEELDLKLNHYGSLTCAQERALKNIFLKFKIDEWLAEQ